MLTRICTCILRLCFSGKNCSEGETLIGDKCIVCYTGQKVGNVGQWCDSYGDKELFIPTSDDTNEELQMFIYMKCRESCNFAVTNIA